MDDRDHDNGRAEDASPRREHDDGGAPASSPSSGGADAAESRNPLWTLSLTNLNPDLTDQQLTAFFKELVGGADVHSAQVLREGGESDARGYGYVHYTSSSSYLAALEEYTEGVEIAGRLTRAAAADEKRKIYVRNLPRDVNENDIREAIEAKTGKCESFNLGGKGGEFCFITYPNFMLADKALKILNTPGELVDGCQLKAEPSKPRDRTVAGSASGNNTSLHVRNLNRSTTREMLEEHFGQCGKIVDVRVPKPRDGHGNEQNQGYAFVEFEDPEDARKAISRLARSQLDGATIEVCFSKNKALGGGRRDGDDRHGGGRDRYDDRYAPRGGPPMPMMGFPPYGYMPPMAGGRGAPGFPPYGYNPYAAMYPGMMAAAGGMAPNMMNRMGMPPGAPPAVPGAGGRDSTTAFPAAGAYGMPPGYPGMYDPRQYAAYMQMMTGQAGAAGAAGVAGASSSKKSSKGRSRSRSPRRRDRSASASRSRSRSRSRDRHRR